MCGQSYASSNSKSQPLLFNRHQHAGHPKFARKGRWGQKQVKLLSFEAFLQLVF